MSVSDLISDGYITLGDRGAFTSEAETQVVTALEGMYASSLEFRALLESLRSGVEALDISFFVNTASAPVLGYQVNIDPEVAVLFIAQDGSAHQASFAHLLCHEVYHAISGELDTEGVDYNIANPDYAGPTVTFTNMVMASYESPALFYNRLTYSGADMLDEGIDFLELGKNYTFGKEVDIALVQLGGALHPSTSPDTSRNTEKIRDLIVDVLNTENRIDTGLGNDFIYGRGGDDLMNGGAGDDYIDGATGEDTVDFMPSAHDASGAVTRGVQLTFDEFGVLATDGWGGADTITGVEAFWLTGFDDVVTVSGDFGLSLASVTDPAIQLVIDAGQEELVGDTLILASSRMLNVDLAGSTASDETGTVIVSDFENVVGGDGADTIFGNGESNRLKGGLGADELYGLDGDDFLFFDADDIVVNGGAGRDVAFAQGGAGVTVDLDDCALDISRRHRTCRRPDRLRQRADAGGRRRGGCAEGGASGHHRTRDPLGRAGGGRSDQPCRPRIELAGAFPGGR